MSSRLESQAIGPNIEFDVGPPETAVVSTLTSVGKITTVGVGSCEGVPPCIGVAVETTSAGVVVEVGVGVATGFGKAGIGVLTAAVLSTSAVISVTGDGVAVGADGNSSAVAVHAVTTLNVTTSPIGAKRRANPFIYREYRHHDRTGLRILTVPVSVNPTCRVQPAASVHVDRLWKVAAEKVSIRRPLFRWQLIEKLELITIGVFNIDPK